MGLARQSTQFDKIGTNSIQILEVPVSGMPDKEQSISGRG
jgi:hypothetical protein